MLWIKAFHLIFMVTWFAGLFYLPRLYVYHAMSTDALSIKRFKTMERKLYYGITTPRRRPHHNLRPLALQPQLPSLFTTRLDAH